MKLKLLCQVVTLFVMVNGVPGQCWGKVGGGEVSVRASKFSRGFFLLVESIYWISSNVC